MYDYVGGACRRVVRSKGSQWHERFCRDPEFMGLNPRWVILFYFYFFVFCSYIDITLE